MMRMDGLCVTDTGEAFSEDVASQTSDLLEIIDLEEEKCPKEVKYNAISLIFNIMKWNLNSISEQFKQSGIQEKLSPYESDLAFIGDLKALLI